MKVCDLACGWELHRDGGTTDPWFVKGAERLIYYDFARKNEAEEVFRSLQRALDISDKDWRAPGLEANYRALDKAKFALETSLRQMGRWSSDMRNSGVHSFHGGG